MSVARCLTGSNQRIDAETETLIPYQGGSFDDTDPTLTSNGDAHSGFRDENGLVVAHTLRAEGFDASEDGTGRQNLVVDQALPWLKCCECGEIFTDKHGTGIDTLAPYECPKCGEEKNIIYAAQEPPLCYENHAQDSWVKEISVAPSLSAKAGTIQHGGQGGRHDGVMTPTSAVRRLTPRECERLQGFPDDYTLIPINNKGGVSADGPRYKALGNSMAVPVMAWIGRRIQMVEDLL